MDPQVEAWVAYKQKGYVKFGATPEQLAQWADYDRKRYTAFLKQSGRIPPEPSSVTVAELTRMMLDQSTRWVNIVTRAVASKHPAAASLSGFLKRTWDPALISYMESMGSIDPTSTVSRAGFGEVLGLVRGQLYPAARQAGFPESSFLFPDAAGTAV